MTIGFQKPEYGQDLSHYRHVMLCYNFLHAFLIIPLHVAATVLGGGL